MSYLMISKILGVLTLIGMKSFLSPVMLKTTLVTLGLSHYIMSFYYGSMTTKRVYLFNKTLSIVFFVLALLVAYFRNPSIIILFGIHHIFSEYYIEKGKNDFHWSFNTLRFSVIAGSYYFFVSKSLFFIENKNLFYALCATWTIYLIVLIWSVLRKKITTNFIQSEIGSFLIFLVFVYFRKFSFLDIIGLHFLIWLYFPLFTLKLDQLKIKYVRDTVISVAILMIIGLVLYLGPLPRFYKVTNMGLQLMLGVGYIHIILAFIHSKHNPTFINKLSGNN